MNRFNLTNPPFRRTSGFTQIEWMVACSLFAVLFAMTAPLFESVRENARAAQCRNNMRSIAFAVLDYENEHGSLPGPIFRAVRRPWVENPGVSAFLEDYFQATPGNPSPFVCPSNETSLAYESAAVFQLNNRQSTNPRRFFGYPDTADEPYSLSEIEAAGRIPPGSFARNLREIWMISETDSSNYPMPGEEPQPPPHAGGRHYVFFDGSLEHRTLDDLPF